MKPIWPKAGIAFLLFLDVLANVVLDGKAYQDPVVHGVHGLILDAWVAWLLWMGGFWE